MCVVCVSVCAYIFSVEEIGQQLLDMGKEFTVEKNRVKTSVRCCNRECYYFTQIHFLMSTRDFILYSFEPKV